MVDYQGARNWVIDDGGRLHIVGAKGNLASFNTGLWHSVEYTGAAE